jgi:hypothetical protein
MIARSTNRSPTVFRLCQNTRTPEFAQSRISRAMIFCDEVTPPAASVWEGSTDCIDDDVDLAANRVASHEET